MDIEFIDSHRNNICYYSCTCLTHFQSWKKAQNLCSNPIMIWTPLAFLYIILDRCRSRRLARRARNSIILITVGRHIQCCPVCSFWAGNILFTDEQYSPRWLLQFEDDGWENTRSPCWRSCENWRTSTSDFMFDSAHWTHRKHMYHVSIKCTAI